MSRDTVLRRSIAGMKAGLGIGAILSVLPIVAAIATGSTVIMVRGSWPAELWSILMAFLVGGPTTGLLAGILSPLARSTITAGVVGAVAGVPVCYLAIGALGAGGTKTGWIATAILSLTLGSTMGVIYRRIFAVEAEQK